MVIIVHCHLYHARIHLTLVVVTPVLTVRAYVNVTIFLIHGIQLIIHVLVLNQITLRMEIIAVKKLFRICGEHICTIRDLTIFNILFTRVDNFVEKNNSAILLRFRFKIKIERIEKNWWFKRKNNIQADVTLGWWSNFYKKKLLVILL